MGKYPRKRVEVCGLWQRFLPKVRAPENVYQVLFESTHEINEDEMAVKAAFGQEETPLFGMWKDFYGKDFPTDLLKGLPSSKTWEIRIRTR